MEGGRGAFGYHAIGIRGDEGRPLVEGTLEATLLAVALDIQVDALEFCLE